MDLVQSNITPEAPGAEAFQLSEASQSTRMARFIDAGRGVVGGLVEKAVAPFEGAPVINRKGAVLSATTALGAGALFGAEAASGYVDHQQNPTSPVARTTTSSTGSGEQVTRLVARPGSNSAGKPSFKFYPAEDRLKIVKQVRQGTKKCITRGSKSILRVDPQVSGNNPTGRASNSYGKAWFKYSADRTSATVNIESRSGYKPCFILANTLGYETYFPGVNTLQRVNKTRVKYSDPYPRDPFDPDQRALRAISLWFMHK